MLQRVITWTITIFVIRLLRPEDYGLMAVAGLLMPTINALTDLGLNAAIVQKESLSTETVRKLYGAILLSSVVLFLMAQLLAGPLASFYGSPDAEALTRVISIAILANAVTSVPAARFTRDLEFRALSIIETLQIVVGALITLFLAWRGFGAWALAIGSLSAVALRTFAIVVVARFSLRPLFNFTGIRDEFRFGGLFLAKSSVNALNRTIAPALIGRLIGVVPLGHFQVASTLSRLPVRLIMRPLQRVAFPVAARAQQQSSDTGTLYAELVGSSLFFVMPACWAIAATASILVPGMLGAQWTSAAPLVTLLSIYLPFLTMQRLLNPVLDGLGNPLASLRNNLRTGLLTAIAIVAGAYWGLTGAVVGWCVGSAAALLLNLASNAGAIGVRPHQLARVIIPVLISSTVMAAAIVSVRLFLQDERSALVTLVLSSGAGALAYLLMTAAINRALAVRLYRRIVLGRA